MGVSMGMTPGKLIDAAIARAGTTQDKLGPRVGVSGSYINMLSRDRRVPTDEMIGKIARALKMTPDERKALKLAVLLKRRDEASKALAEIDRQIAVNGPVEG